VYEPLVDDRDICHTAGMMDLSWRGVVAGVAGTVVFGCGPTVGPSQDTDETTAVSDVDPSESTGPTDPTDPSDTNPSDPSDPSDPSAPDPTGPSPAASAVDILFVIDNSGTMGEEQGRLAAASGQLVAALDAAGLDWRIAITTTDNGNPWCGGTSPEAGSFRASSCLARTNEFIFNGNPPQDATAVACTDVCSESDIAILPTDAGDGETLPRPWLERTAGVANVDVDPAAALACMLPQGIDGCGFESPLESMYKALLRVQSDAEDERGFLRDDAVLAIVFASDETDCSYNSDHESIFLPAEEGGQPVFWSDPDAPAPTSAVCWNAGVTCEGGPSQYDTCYAENKDVLGSRGVSDDDAVLMPVSRYTELLQGIEDLRQQFAPGREVIVAGITGVPSGFVDGAPIVYADSPDPIEQSSFGIGPGCTSEGTTALPPVREREVAEAFSVGDRPALYSVCDSDYGPTIAAITEQILAQAAGG
jgi:hypothetical protein